MLYNEKYGQGIYSECLRKIKVNLRYTLLNGKNKIIAITSSNMAEGKSTISANLAFSLSQEGKKVFLIEGDLRKPSLHKIFKIYNEYGLTSILIGEKKINEAIGKYNDNLDIILSGPIPPNPCELLESDIFSGFLNNAKEKYDYIIIDSPPILPIADTQVIMNKVDGVILVVRNDKTTKSNLVKVKKIMEVSNTKLLGAVLNRDKAESSSYYYY